MAGAGMLNPSLLSVSRLHLSGLILHPGGILPEGVTPAWDIPGAFHETTPTRERICINGLWKWQPGPVQTERIPENGWGYFKVPARWPGIKNYMQRDSQDIYPHPDWKDQSLENIEAAWYHREITIPEPWEGRRIIIGTSYLNSDALIFIDGRKAGELLFPGGELDVTDMCRPGGKYRLTMKVTAIPLKEVVAIYSDTNAPRQGKGLVINKGLCGDIFLCSTPGKARLGDVRVNTRIGEKKIEMRMPLENLEEKNPYSLQIRIADQDGDAVKIIGRSFTRQELEDGELRLTESWIPDKLWDIHTPGNMFNLTVSLLDWRGRIVDVTYPERIGFRELRIEGRDFYLNGKRIFLSAVPFDNAQIGAARSAYEGARETMLRLKSFGINLVYSHNYGTEPGDHLSFKEILRAADDVGMLFSLSQPHFGQYNWDTPDADRNNGYARHASFYTRVAGNHPAVVFYATSHNATGYNEDMNPDRIDGIYRPSMSGNIQKALRAETIIHSLDPWRIVYHHSSGNLGTMHTSNFYPNWVPIQELADWFGHWATVGIKPLFLVEFGAPFPWDWGLYRGWYKGKRAFGTSAVPYEFCLAEWNSQFMGDHAYEISEEEKTNLRWEAERFREGKVWYRWDYPYPFGSVKLEECNPIYAMHIRQHWRAFRTWGLSVNSPWDHSAYWKRKHGSPGKVKSLTTDWEHLQKPGFSPDFISPTETMETDIGNGPSDWIPTVAARELMRNNMPLLAYIGGKKEAFTSRDHHFLPGETFEKQLIVINNSREMVTCECSWSFNLEQPVSGNHSIGLEAGHQERLPVKLELPESLHPGTYTLTATFHFSNGEMQEDSFEIHVLPQVRSNLPQTATALFDPKGYTRALLDKTGMNYQMIDSSSDLSEFEVVIIGREALDVDNDGPDLTSVRDGLKTIVFEQTSEVLEKRLGFRIQNYGLRQVFARIPDHPVLEGLTNENLCNWRGSSSLLPERLNYETDDHVFNGAPTIRWCDIPVTRIWRCGNRGNTASTLIEKPACGDFLPLIDGGFSLQYSPLMEYHEGKGMILFCQMDVTGRTEFEPAAARLVSNILSYVSKWKPSVKRQVVYAGEEPGIQHLKKTGISVSAYRKDERPHNRIFILGPGNIDALPDRRFIAGWIRQGGRLLAVGLTPEVAGTILPFPVEMKNGEHISSYFEPQGMISPFTGISPADAHNRAPLSLTKLNNESIILGDGILAGEEKTGTIFCQLVPWHLDYGNGQHNVKQTFRRWSFLLSRVLGNMGAESSTPLAGRFKKGAEEGEKRWLTGFYPDEPEEWDDPYRFFRW